EPLFKRTLLSDADAAHLYAEIGDEYLNYRFQKILSVLKKQSVRWLLERAGDPTSFLKNSGLLRSAGGGLEIYSKLFPVFLQNNKAEILKKLDTLEHKTTRDSEVQD